MAGEVNMKRLRAGVVRRIWWATSLRWSLLLLVGIGLAFVITWPSERAPWIGLIVLTAVAAAWLPSLMRSRQQRQLIGFSGHLLAQGRLQDAEVSLTHALQQFSLATGPQVVGCHYMAVLAHARQQFAEGVGWCRAVLRYAQRSARAIRRTSQILMADCLVCLGRLEEAYQVLEPLYEQPLSLSDQLMVLPVQLRYELAAGHYDSALADLPGRVRLAELLETKPAATVHALLAVACKATGRPKEADFLWQRVQAFGDESVIQEYSPRLEQACSQDQTGS